MTHAAMQSYAIRIMDTKEQAERVTINMSGELATYVKGQAAAELRTVSNMISFMVEEYRRNHQDPDNPSALHDTMQPSAPNH